MAKRKKKATSDPLQVTAPKPIDVTNVTWRNTFNGLTLANSDRSALAAEARAHQYEFLAWSGDVYDVRNGCEAKIGATVDVLQDGITLNTYADGRYTYTPLGGNVAWVVMNQMYEYDDERHHPRGVDVVEVFSTEQAAQDSAERYQINYLMTTTESPFELIADNLVDSDDVCDDIVKMGYALWHDWLIERGVEPPEVNEYGRVSLESFQTWWNRGIGSRSYNFSTGSYTNHPGQWSANHRRAAVEHLNFKMYYVDTVKRGLVGG